MPAVLFVCTANICRSPMASTLFQKIAAERHPGGSWRVESAGTWAMDGLPAAENSQLVMSQRGLDLSEHRSRRVSDELLQSFDLILAMEKGQKEALCAEFPTLAQRVYLLSEMVGLMQDVDDPIGRPLDDFEETAKGLERLFELGFERITLLTIGTPRD